jgi:hypothetical protein
VIWLELPITGATADAIENLTQGLVNGKQLIEHSRQRLQIERVRAVRLCLRWIIVDLKKYPVHTRRHRRSR